jgi:hypothetical protein
MTKQKSGADEKTSPTRARAAKIPGAAAIPPAEANVHPSEEAIFRAEEATSAAETPPVVAEAAPEVAFASAPEPVAAEAGREVAPARAPEAELPAQIVLLANEAEAIAREEAEPFSWSNRSLDFWKENAKALYRLAEELGAARTPSEIMEAQTKFAVERLRAFGRHAEAIAAVRAKFFFAA